MKKRLLLLLFPIFLSADIKDIIENDIDNNVSQSYYLKTQEAILNKANEEASFLPTVALTGNTYKTFGSTLDDSSVDNSSSATIKLSYNLFDGGTRNLNIKESENLLKIANNNKIIFDNNIVYNTLTLYIQGLKYTNTLNTLKLKEATLTKEIQRNNSLYKVSLTTKESLARLQADYFKNKNKILEIENALEKIKSNIYLISHINVDTFNQEVLFDKVEFDRNSYEIKNILLSNDNLKLNYKKSISNFLPTINFSTDFSFSKYELNGGYVSNTSKDGKFLLSFSYNLYNGGKDSNTYQANKIKYLANTLSSNYDIEEKETNFKNALKDLDLLENKLSTSFHEKQAFEINYSNIKTQFNQKLVTNIEYLDALTELYDSIININNIKYDIELQKLNIILLSGHLIKNYTKIFNQKKDK